VKKCQPEAPEETNLVTVSFPFLIFQEWQRFCTEIALCQFKPRDRVLGDSLGPDEKPTVGVPLATIAKRRSVCYFLWMMCFEISGDEVANK